MPDRNIAVAVPDAAPPHALTTVTAGQAVLVRATLPIGEYRDSGLVLSTHRGLRAYVATMAGGHWFELPGTVYGWLEEPARETGDHAALRARHSC